MSVGANAITLVHYLSARSLQLSEPPAPYDASPVHELLRASATSAYVYVPRGPPASQAPPIHQEQPSQAKPRQDKPSQAQSSQAKSAQARSSQVKSTQVKSGMASMAADDDATTITALEVDGGAAMGLALELELGKAQAISAWYGASHIHSHTCYTHARGRMHVCICTRDARVHISRAIHVHASVGAWYVGAMCGQTGNKC